MRRRPTPVPPTPTHRRDWSRWGRWCACGLRWKSCPDRLNSGLAPPHPIRATESTSPPPRTRPTNRGPLYPDQIGATTVVVRTAFTRKPTTGQPRPHTPIRPLWLCRVCASPWPCGEARLALLHEYAADRVALNVYLCSALHEATHDLHRLNPFDGPTPADLFARFIAWIRPTIL